MLLNLRYTVPWQTIVTIVGRPLGWWRGYRSTFGLYFELTGRSGGPEKSKQQCGQATTRSKDGERVETTR